VNLTPTTLSSTILHGALLTFCILIIPLISFLLVLFNKCFNFAFRFIVICPPHGIEDYLEIYLEVDPGCANLTEGRKKTENFNLALIDQVNDERTIRKGIFYLFCKLYEE